MINKVAIFLLLLISSKNSFPQFAFYDKADMVKFPSTNYFNSIYTETLQVLLNWDTTISMHHPFLIKLKNEQDEGGKIYVQIESGANIDSLPKKIGIFTPEYFYSKDCINYIKKLKSSKYFVSIGATDLENDTVSTFLEMRIIEKKSWKLLNYGYDIRYLKFAFDDLERQWNIVPPQD